MMKVNMTASAGQTRDVGPGNSFQSRPSSSTILRTTRGSSRLREPISGRTALRSPSRTVTYVCPCVRTVSLPASKEQPRSDSHRRKVALSITSSLFWRHRRLQWPAAPSSDCRRRAPYIRRPPDLSPNRQSIPPRASYLTKKRAILAASAAAANRDPLAAGSVRLSPTNWAGRPRLAAPLKTFAVARSKVPSDVRHQARLKPKYGETNGYKSPAD